MSDNPHGNGTVFTFTWASESKARDMIAQLPAYMEFLYTELALEYFTAEDAAWDRESPWDDVKKCTHSVIDNELDALLGNNKYRWNTRPTKI